MRDLLVGLQVLESELVLHVDVGLLRNLARSLSDEVNLALSVKMAPYERLRVQVLEAARSALGNHTDLQLRRLGIHITEVDNTSCLAGFDCSENHLEMRFT